MTNEDYQKKMNEIQGKLGEEHSALILDDIAYLISDNTQMNNVLLEKENRIKELDQTNQNLQKVNANLFQQVSVGQETKPEIDEKDETADFDMRSAFDEKGNFKR